MLNSRSVSHFSKTFRMIRKNYYHIRSLRLGEELEDLVMMPYRDLWTTQDCSSLTCKPWDADKEIYKAEYLLAKFKHTQYVFVLFPNDH